MTLGGECSSPISLHARCGAWVRVQRQFLANKSDRWAIRFLPIQFGCNSIEMPTNRTCSPKTTPKMDFLALSNIFVPTSILPAFRQHHSVLINQSTASIKPLSDAIHSVTVALDPSQEYR